MSIRMVGATSAHGLIVSNLVTLCCARLDPQQWMVIVYFGLDAGPRTLR